MSRANVISLPASPKVETASAKPILGYAGLAEFLTAEGYPITTSGVKKLAERHEGPPSRGIWAKKLIFDSEVVLGWAEARVTARHSRRKTKAATETLPPIADQAVAPALVGDEEIPPY